MGRQAIDAGSNSYRRPGGDVALGRGTVGRYSEPGAPQTVLKLWAAPLWTSLAIPLGVFPLTYVVASKRSARGQ